MILFWFMAGFEWDSLALLPDSVEHIKDICVVGERIFVGVDCAVSKKNNAGIYYMDEDEGLWQAVDSFFEPCSSGNQTRFSAFYFDTTINRLFATVREERLPGPYHFYHFSFSDDTGKTWTHIIADSGGGIDMPREMRRLSDGNLYFAGGVNYNDSERNGRIYISYDNGETWEIWKKTSNGEAGEFQFILVPDTGVIWTASNLGRSYYLYEDTLGRSGALIKKSKTISGIFMMVKRETDYIASMCMTPTTTETRIYAFDGEDNWTSVLSLLNMYTGRSLLYSKADSLTLIGMYDYESKSLIYFLDLSNNIVMIDSSFNGYGAIDRMRFLNDGRLAVALHQMNTMENKNIVYITKKDTLTSIEVPFVSYTSYEETGSASLYDIMGNRVEGSPASGIYFIKESTNGSVSVKRIIIVR